MGLSLITSQGHSGGLFGGEGERDQFRTTPLYPPFPCPPTILLLLLPPFSLLPAANLSSEDFRRENFLWRWDPSLLSSFLPQSRGWAGKPPPPPGIMKGGKEEEKRRRKTNYASAKVLFSQIANKIYLNVVFMGIRRFLGFFPDQSRKRQFLYIISFPLSRPCKANNLWPNQTFFIFVFPLFGVEGK